MLLSKNVERICKNCMVCMAGSIELVEACVNTDCPYYSNRISPIDYDDTDSAIYSRTYSIDREE